jgi:hypothetical protein
MSNAMSRSKSRWKSAVLAGAALAVITPLAAKAQTATMSLSLSLSPIGNVVNYGAGGLSSETGGSPGTSEYIAPDQNADIYVYATITQQNPVSTTSTATSNIAGFQYAYFNVLQNNGSSGTTYDTTQTNPSGIAINGISSLEGSVVSVIPGPGLSAFGSQPGVTNYTSGTYAVGAAGDGLTQLNLTSMGKARSASPIWSTRSANSTNGYNPNGYTTGSGDGTDVFVSGNTISFLLETLVYKPTFTLEGPNGTLTGNGVNTLTVVVPSLPSTYAGSNYFANNTNSSTGSETNSNSSVGANYTYTSYKAAGATVGGYSFSSTVNLYDAASADGNLDGFVNQNDLTPIYTNYGTPNSGFVDGDYILDGSSSLNPNVNQNDLTPVYTNYGESYGPSSTPGGGANVIGVPTVVIGGSGGTSAVPEPGSLALLSIGSLSLLRRKRKSI